MTQVIMQASFEADKAAIVAVREADNPVSIAKPIHTMPSSGVHALRQPTFDCEAVNKYWELCSFETEVKKIFISNNYNTLENRWSL